MFLGILFSNIPAQSAIHTIQNYAMHLLFNDLPKGATNQNLIITKVSKTGKYSPVWYIHTSKLQRLHFTSEGLTTVRHTQYVTPTVTTCCRYFCFVQSSYCRYLWCEVVSYSSQGPSPSSVQLDLFVEFICYITIFIIEECPSQKEVEHHNRPRPRIVSTPISRR